MTNWILPIKILLIFFLITNHASGEVCDDAYIDFSTEASAAIDKKMMTSIEFDNFNYQLKSFKEKIKNEECFQSSMDMASEYIEAVKNKRIETLKKFKKMGIKEEGGKSVSGELDYLTGVAASESEEIPKGSFTKIPPASKTSPIKISPVVIKTVNSGKCSETILENDAVNLENVRDQDTVGWCYAFTGADLLSYKLNQRISAVSLYNSGEDIEKNIGAGDIVQGGDIGSSITKYLDNNNGLCLESELPSSDFKFCTDNLYKDFLVELVSVAKNKSFAEEYNNNQCFEENLQKAFPGNNISFIQNYINGHGGNKLIESIYNYQCKNLVAKKLSVKSETFVRANNSPEKLLEMIDQQLSSGNLSALAYDYNKLNKEEGSGAHGSIVVGRRKNPKTGNCDYLIRNSWGKSCSQNEDSELTCHKKCDGGSCRYTGNFWVSGNRIKEAILGVNYLR
jgi:hypothetical protein